MPFITSTLMAGIALGTAAVGTAVSAVGQAKAGTAAQNAANQNANNNVITANNTLENAGIQESQQRYQDRLVLAEGRAAAGASGVDVNSGSPMDVMSENARQAELNALYIRRAGRLDASAQLRGAQSNILAGQAAKSAANYGVAGTLLTGGANVATSAIALRNTKGIKVPPLTPGWAADLGS